MTSTPSTGWRELPRSTKSECPKLFYVFSREKDSLSLKLTDLVAIWECSLDRTGIVHSARDQESAIDPSESTAQLHVLLDKLERSLEAGNNYLCREENSADQIVYLATRLDLPKPLKPLEWIFKLSPQDAGELAEQLLRPCLHEASVAQQKIESLLRVIKDKDHVLSRLLEKIDSTAIDLSLIFPGITGLKSRKGRVTVQEAQKHVPGMANFDHDRWSNVFDDGNQYANFGQMGMSRLVAGCEQCPKHTVKQHCDWYRALPPRGSKFEFHIPDSKRSAKRKTIDPPQQDKSTDTESDFERQATPPHLRKIDNATKKSPQSQVQDSTSEFKQEDARPSKKAKTGKIGRLGSRKANTQTSRRSSSSSEQGQRRPNAKGKQKKFQQQREESEDLQSGTETATESDDLSGPPSTKFDTKKPATAKIDTTKPGTLNKLGALKSRSSKEPSPQTRSVSPVKRHSSTSSTRSPTSSQHHNKTKNPRNKPPSQNPKTKHNSDDETDTASEPEQSPPNPSPTKPAKSTKKGTPSATSGESNTNPITKQNMNTPTKRRLGLLTRSTHSRSKSPSTTPSKPKTHPENSSDLPVIKAETQAEADADTETASECDAEPEENINTAPSPSKPERTPSPPEPTKPETAEERANRRRDELKQRLNAGTGGGRKKRKF